MEPDDLLPSNIAGFLKTGSSLLKCGKKGAPHFRFFHLDDSFSKLVWTSPKKTDTESTVSLASVKEIRTGQNTAIFHKNKRPEWEHLAFSLVYEEGRTLDLVCKDSAEFDLWVTGLKSLTVGPQSVSDVLKDEPMSPKATRKDSVVVKFKGKKTVVEVVEESFDVYSWGQGTKGRLGHGDENDQYSPKVIEALLGKGVKGIACGPSHTAAWTEEGDVYTWGAGSNGRLGHGHERDRFTPLIVTALHGVPIKQVACGDYHTAAIADTGTLYCWGKGTDGRLGLGNETTYQTPQPVAALSTRYIKYVACGYMTTGAVTVEGEVLMWGGNEKGQLGIGSKEKRLVPIVLEFHSAREPQDEENEQKREQRDTAEHNGAEESIARLKTWAKVPGRDQNQWEEHRGSKLNISNTKEAAIAALVLPGAHDPPLGSNAVDATRSAITASTLAQSPPPEPLFPWLKKDASTETKMDSAAVLPHYATTLTATTTVTSRISGRKYNSSNGHRATVGSMRRIASIACATWHSAAVSEVGEVFTWGDGLGGKLGHGSELEVLVPTMVRDLRGTNATQVACGDFHTTVLTDMGQVFTWGEGNYGQLGHGAAVAQYNKPLSLGQRLFGHQRVEQVACGSNHSAALTTTGSLYTWGYGVNGRLGHDDEHDKKTPSLVAIMGKKTVRTIVCGGAHSCATVLHGWVPDAESDQCMACKTQFTVIRRRHHCRDCGGIFCGACSSKKTPLLKSGFAKPVRVCDKCFALNTSKMKPGATGT